MAINNFQTIIGLLNGMIGGTILILPLLGIVVGYMSVIFITLILSMISGYTAYLIVKHLGKAANIKQSILSHFNQNNKMTVFYNIFITITFWPAIFGYFHLLVLQIKGLFDIQSWLLPLGLFIIVFLMTLVLKKYQLGQKLLAYGIISIIGYIIFLIWAQITAPKGQNKVQPFGQSYPNFSAVLMFALAIHDFVVQVLIHNPNRKDYSKLIFFTYIFGATAYLFMGLGSFAIINRIPTKQNPQVIGDYFMKNQWQVHVIQALYAVHLLTALPEYLLISNHFHRVRWLQGFGYEQQQSGLQIKQISYIFITLFVSYLLFILDIKIATLLQIGGSVMGFIYIIVIPILIHFKCVYYDKASGYLQNDEEYNKSIKQHQCQCDVTYKNKYLRGLQIIWMAFTIAVGLYITIYTLNNIFFEKKKE